MNAITRNAGDYPDGARSMVGNEKYPRQRNSWRSELDTGRNCIVTTQIAFHDSNRGLGAPNVLPYFGFVNADHNFWIEHHQQSLEVPLSRQKRVNELSLLEELRWFCSISRWRFSFVRDYLSVYGVNSGAPRL